MFIRIRAKKHSNFTEQAKNCQRQLHNFIELLKSIKYSIELIQIFLRLQYSLELIISFLFLLLLQKHSCWRLDSILYLLPLWRQELPFNNVPVIMRAFEALCILASQSCHLQGWTSLTFLANFFLYPQLEVIKLMFVCKLFRLGIYSKKTVRQYKFRLPIANFG